jgi:biotin-(acetyl-CoA carboxylase) ligase
VSRKSTSEFIVPSINSCSSNADIIINSCEVYSEITERLNDKNDTVFQLKEIKREEINTEKFTISYESYNKDGKKIDKPNILLEVIHVDTIESIMSSSRDYILEGNKLPFIYNTKNQTKESGKSSGSILGNLYTSSCIPNNMIKNRLIDNDILVKITAISIFQQLIKYNKDAFKLEYPNDILCVEHGGKLGEINVENYFDFQIIEFWINIVDKPETEKTEKIETNNSTPCFVDAHLSENIDKPNAIDFSIEVTKQIIINLKLTKNDINKLFEEYNKIKENN